MPPESNVYIISWILWNLKDISWHMIEKIFDTKLLFVENRDEFLMFFDKLGIDYKWIVVQMDYDWNYLEENKNMVLNYLSLWKNIWLFETWWTACFYDPWVDFVNFIYAKIKDENYNIKMLPIVWWSALMTAISVCWFELKKFSFQWFLVEKIKPILRKSKVPVIFFQEYDNPKDLERVLVFMKKEKKKEVFIWINLWKKFDRNSENKANILIRWIYCDAYNELVKIVNNKNIRDITLIFKV